MKRLRDIIKESKELPDVDWFMRYESGDMDHDEAVKGFQHLVDTGAWRHLQGHYGRTAKALIDAGLVRDTHGQFGRKTSLHEQGKKG